MYTIHHAHGWLTHTHTHTHTTKLKYNLWLSTRISSYCPPWVRTADSPFFFSWSMQSRMRQRWSRGGQLESLPPPQGQWSLGGQCSLLYRSVLVYVCEWNIVLCRYVVVAQPSICYQDVVLARASDPIVWMSTHEKGWMGKGSSHYNVHIRPHAQTMATPSHTQLTDEDISYSLFIPSASMLPG